MQNVNRLVIANIIMLGIVILLFLLSSKFRTGTPTELPVTETPVTKPSATKSPATKPPMPTFSPFPSPIIGVVGTNLPSNFNVESWKDNYVTCDNRYIVLIYGAEISHGNPPYNFTFWYFDNKYQPVIKSVTPLTESKDLVEFDEPIVVGKGTFIHVTLTFQLEDNTGVIWIDDLYYSLVDPRCP